jgi:signal transduction histidine kinase
MITPRRRLDKKVLWGLAAGFGLTILLMLSAGYLGIRAIDTVEERSEELLRQHRAATQLIDEIQGEEAGLSSLFYALAAAPGPVDGSGLLHRLDGLEAEVRQTLQAAGGSSTAERWEGARAAVENFIAEVRLLLTQAGGGRLELPARFFRAHEELVSEISKLVAANYQLAIEQERRESAAHRERLRNVLVLLGGALVLSTLCAVATVRIATSVFRRVIWQARELSRLSGHVLNSQEELLHRFSRELHDEFGQSLTAIEANLAAVPQTSPEAAPRVEDCTLLVKDLMSKVRELSQFLRPSGIDDFGLGPSLQSLAESFTQRTGIRTDLRLEYGGRLEGETETHLFRIAQEALTNVARHSGAERVRLALERRGDRVRLTIADDGGGLKPTQREGGGLGLAGMRERMRVSGGELQILSSPQGVTVIAEVTAHEAEREANPDFAG